MGRPGTGRARRTEGIRRTRRHPVGHGHRHDGLRPAGRNRGGAEHQRRRFGAKGPSRQSCKNRRNRRRRPLRDRRAAPRHTRRDVHAVRILDDRARRRGGDRRGNDHPRPRDGGAAQERVVVVGSRAQPRSVRIAGPDRAIPTKTRARAARRPISYEPSSPPTTSTRAVGDAARLMLRGPDAGALNGKRRPGRDHLDARQGPVGDPDRVAAVEVLARGNGRHRPSTSSSRTTGAAVLHTGGSRTCGWQRGRHRLRPGAADRGGQRRGSGAGPDLGIAHHRRQRQAVGQLRPPVRRGRPGLRSRQLRQPAGGERFLLPQSEHAGRRVQR